MFSHRSFYPRYGRNLILLFFFSAVLVASCNSNKKESVPTDEKVIIKQSFIDKAVEKEQENMLLLEVTCLYCHEIGTNPNIENARSMQVIRDVYKDKYPSKQDFISAMIDFTVTPSTNNHAINDCGLMDDAGHSDEDIQDIAAFLFDYKF